VTIRKTLLIAFLLVSLIPAILLTSLAFLTAGSSMREEIGRSLLVQSSTVSDDIDKMLFERLQNALTWRRLEVMQDIQVNDIDKRLASFLAELKNGYRDVYQELSCTDPAGRIVASSNASIIGQILPKPSTLLQVADHIALEPLQLDEKDGQALLAIHADVPAQFKTGTAGELVLRFNWGQIYNILDQAAQGGRMVMLIDKQNRIIAASERLRKQGMLLAELPAGWLPNDKSGGVASLDGAPFNQPEVTIGYDRSDGFEHFPGFGWTTVVIEPSSQAYIPVKRMALVFLALLAVAITFAAGLSLLVAGRISRPIAALTDFTRRFTREKKLSQPPKPTGGEVGELTEAFVSTVEALEQSRADLVRASKLAVLGEIAAVMAHEIRTPVGILRSSAQMLAREPDMSAEALELTGFIVSETERLNRLVTTLLDSARPRTVDRQPTDFRALINHCLDLLSSQAEKKSIHLTRQLEASSTVVPCDAEQMTQVLLNLILNALQIVPSGGQVSVACKVSDGKLILEVADNGPGIPAEEMERIFDPFFTRREGGVGLGLAVVQQIVAAHHGEIRAGKSALGGALFTVTLPVEEPS
jgi:two-component system sensor histidine kinase HydH